MKILKFFSIMMLISTTSPIVANANSFDRELAILKGNPHAEEDEGHIRRTDSSQCTCQQAHQTPDSLLINGIQYQRVKPAKKPNH